jgi:uncharacterized protein (DUF486 family)
MVTMLICSFKKCFLMRFAFYTQLQSQQRERLFALAARKADSINLYEYVIKKEY